MHCMRTIEKSTTRVSQGDTRHGMTGFLTKYFFIPGQLAECLFGKGARTGSAYGSGTLSHEYDNMTGSLWTTKPATAKDTFSEGSKI